MTTALEAAFPLNSNWPAATVRSKLAQAMIGVFDTPDLSGEDFSIQPYAAIAIVGPAGDLTFYAFDAGDTTTADDGGITCIVVSGRRYIRSGEVIVRDAAISATISVQPATPTFGDTYIVPPAPSGDDWSGQAKTVATYTARGWIFRQPFVGMIAYVEDEDGLYHYDSSGVWVAGLPIGAIADRSIPVTKLDDPFAIIKVEDVRNDPPGTAPTIGTSYIVGTAPTGDFIGHVNDVARWTGALWTFLPPTEGDTIYRRDEEQLYTYRSGVWTITSQVPAIERSYFKDRVTEVILNGASMYDHVSSPPIIAEPAQFIRVTIKAEAPIQTGGGGTVYAGIRIDTESEIPVERQIPGGGLGSGPSFIVFQFPVPDPSPHIYSLTTRRTSGGAPTPNTITAFFEVVNVS